MNISMRDGYTTVLVKGRTMLSTQELSEQTTCFIHLFHEKQLVATDKIIVAFASEIDLLPVTWALLMTGVQGVFLPREMNDNLLAEVIQATGARFILQKEKSDSGKTIISQLDDSLTRFAGQREHEPASLIFYEDIIATSYRVIRKAIDHYFEKLDSVSLPDSRDVMLISTGIPFSGRLLGLIWASARGIPVIIDDVSGEMELSVYDTGNDRLTMDFGLFHFGSYVESSHKNKYRLLLDTVRFADANDFTAVWTPERHFNDFGGLFPNPSVMSAALAMITSNVQIRSGSLVSPLHNTIRIAEDWSLVDNLSNGRVAISFASGWQCDDFIFSPDRYPYRHDCMLQQISEVRNLWEGGKMTGRNGLQKDIEVGIFPKPVQKKLPVWITVSGRTETFIDAGKIGANILTHLLWQDTDELIEKIAAYRKSLTDNGFDARAFKVAVMVHTYLGEDNDVVKEKVRQPLKTYIRTSTQLIQSMAKSNATSSYSKEVGGRYGTIENEVPEDLLEEMLEIAFNRFFEEAALLGTVEKAKKLIQKLKRYDVDEIAALIDFGLERDDILEGLVHLNTLRKQYEKNKFTGYKVTISHCTANELKSLLPGTLQTRFFAAQKLILAEAMHMEAVPEIPGTRIDVLNRLNEATPSIIADIISLHPAKADITSMFTAAISSEF